MVKKIRQAYDELPGSVEAILTLSDFFGLVRGKRQRNLVKQWEKVPKSEYRCENEDKGL